MKQSAMLECLHKLQPLDKTTTRYKQLVSSAMVWSTYQDKQPIAVVDGSSFCNLMAIAEPWFVMSSCTYFMQTEISHTEITRLQQPCCNFVRLSQGCHKVMTICARCLQPCRVVTTLHHGCEVVVEILKLLSTSKS